MAVDSCTKSSLVLTLTDAEDGGITYIQGQGASCRQNTVSGTSQHTFDFASCGIAWVSIDLNYSPNHMSNTIAETYAILLRKNPSQMVVKNLYHTVIILFE